jgi:DNA-binding MarR family transcriptional regulator
VNSGAFYFVYPTRSSQDRMKKIEDEIRQKKFASIHQKAVLNLIYTSNWLQGKQQEFFKTFKITGQQYNILRILKGQFPNSISGTEIKSRMLDRNSDVSRLLDRLASKKLITKKVCPKDKRASDVLITDTGLELLAEMSKSDAMDNLLGLSDEEANQLSDLLDKARD